MVIHFDSIDLHNFMSFEDAHIQFDYSGYILVRGKNTNALDNASSNGSGKTAIFEALIWTLTGETLRGTKDVVNSINKSGAYVRVKFTYDNKTYEILRSKEDPTYKTNLKIWINGIDVSGKGIRDSEALLSSYLPDLSS